MHTPQNRMRLLRHKAAAKGFCRETKEVITMKATTTTKAKQGIRSFLELRGFEILEDGWKSGKDTADYIARDENGDLVFIDTRIHGDNGEGFPADKPNRQKAERIAAAYLTQAEVEPSTIRFDIVSMLILGSERAMIRHYRNALSVA